MHRSIATALLLAGALGVVLAEETPRDASPGGAGSSEQGPDMIVVVLDSWRADALEREVEGRAVMPRLREWARRAVVFSEARAPSPSTPTSVGSLLSSRSVRAFGGTFSVGLPERATTIAERLGKQGYETLAFSANPNCRLGLGHGQGFEHFEEAFADPVIARDQGRIREDHPAILVPAGRLLEDVRARLERAEGDRPLFAYVHVLQPHAPYRAEEPHAGVFTREGMPEISLEIPDLAARERAGRLDDDYLETLRAHYDELVHETDAALGAFLAWIDAHPRWSQAALVVTSDHGEAFGEHGRLLHNTTLFEEMLRIPLILRLPGGPDEGRVVEERVGLIDLAPTLAALAGTSMPPGAEGIDLTPLARGLDATPRRRFLASTATSSREDMLLIGSRKLVCATDACVLYDLDDDPGETHDLGASRTVQRDAMKRALRKLLARLEDSGLGRAPVETPSEHERELLRSLGYTGGD